MNIKIIIHIYIQMKMLLILSNLFNIAVCFMTIKTINKYNRNKNHMSNGAFNEFTIPFINSNNVGTQWTYNDVLINLKNKNIDAASIVGNKDDIIFLDNNYDDVITNTNIHITKTIPHLKDIIIDRLNENHINYDIININDSFFTSLSFPLKIFMWYFILSLIINILRGISIKGGSGMMSNPFDSINKFVSSGNQIINAEDINTKFDDVAGCDESKYELEEVVEFLKDPKKFQEAGAIIPKGVLLEGPPGTGKTLLARACAGEAGVAFISVSGSQFIEMYVGVGASRVRNLFEMAEKNKPCIIFIDEIDAIGRQRGAGFAGGNDEREQTLNQILTNMDGFDKKDGVVVLAATNRVDILDSALTRPGRFDRKIKVNLPDKYGRKKIMKIHFKNKKIDKDIDFDEMGELTSGFSGADIENLANEAAILSIRHKENKITKNILYDAFEKVTIGLPNKNDKREEAVLELISYHETGHAMMASFFKEFFDLRKITINSNQVGAGGYTLFTPKERFSNYPTKKFMLSNMIVALGGRAAEVVLYENQEKPKLTYNESILFKDIDNLDITTGASNDLKQANSIARKYVALFGLSDDIGLYDINDNAQPFLGKELASGSNKLSEYSKEKIDKHVEKLIDYAYKTAVMIIRQNPQALNKITTLLLNKKTIDGSEIININIELNDDK